jgi:N-acetylneuraminate synthase
MKFSKYLTELSNQPNEIYVIAEAGINHNGDIRIAKKLCEEAKKAGCDSIKFQKRTVEVVYSKKTLDEPRDSPWGHTQRDQKLGLELTEKDFNFLAKFCSEINLDFSASAWDFESLDFIESLNPGYHKVASAFINHEAFLRKVASFKRPTIVSTGMSTLEDVDKSMEIFQEYKCPVVLLHSVSVYPCELEELNLSMITTYKKRFKVPIGYSGHESSVSPSLFAAALGARVIERHFTLDRSMYGSDQAASLEIEGMRRLVAGLRKFPLVLGTGIKEFGEKELGVAKKLRYWEK